MPDLYKIKAYFSTISCSISNLASSMGQSYFAVNDVSQFLFQGRSSVGGATFIATAIAAGFVKNMITIVPAIHIKFGSPEVQKTEDEPNESLNLHWGPYLIHQTFKGSALLSGLFTSINAHLGIIVLSNLIDSIINSNEEDEEAPIWKLIVIEACAIYVAYNLCKKYHAYDYKFLSNNSGRMAKAIEQKDYHLNKKALAKTLLFSSFNLIASPILAAFFSGPAFSTIPFFEKIVGATGINICTWLASGSAFVSGIATLPNIYDYFNDNQSIVFPETALTKAIRYNAYISGCIDSFYVGLVNVVAVNNTANLTFQWDRYGYINILSILCGLSAASQNILFSVRPGYLDLLKHVYKKQLQLNYNESQPILRPINQDKNEVSDPRALKSVTYSGDDYDNSDDSNHSDKEIIKQGKNSSYYQADAGLGLLFANKNTDNAVRNMENTLKPFK